MQKKILSLVIPSILIILASLGLISYLRVHDSIKRSYEDRIGTANMIARYVDQVLQSNLTRLYDISLSDKINLKDNDWGPERQALRDAYEYSIFTDGLFLLDRDGNILLRYPHREGAASLHNVPFVRTFISKMKPVISSVYTVEPTRKKVIFILVPLKDRDGEVVGAATFITTSLEGDQAIQGFNFLIPVATIQQMATDIGLKPSTGDPFMQAWEQAVAAYFQGDFGRAMDRLEAADKLQLDGRPAIARREGGVRRIILSGGGGGVGPHHVIGAAPALAHVTHRASEDGGRSTGRDRRRPIAGLRAQPGALAARRDFAGPGGVPQRHRSGQVW